MAGIARPPESKKFFRDDHAKRGGREKWKGSAHLEFGCPAQFACVWFVEGRNLRREGPESPHASPRSGMLPTTRPPNGRGEKRRFFFY